MSRCVSILPFGLEQRTTQDGDNPRYTYQGDFAEKDGETGWNHFKAREYDPVIGRWTSVDPARQFHSPYVGMGNNPTSAIDPDGEWVNFAVGFAIGFGSDVALQVATNMVLKGDNFANAVKNVDYADAAIDGLVGAATMGLSKVNTLRKTVDLMNKTHVLDGVKAVVDVNLKQGLVTDKTGSDMFVDFVGSKTIGNMIGKGSSDIANKSGLTDQGWGKALVETGSNKLMSGQTAPVVDGVKTLLNQSSENRSGARTRAKVERTREK